MITWTFIHGQKYFHWWSKVLLLMAKHTFPLCLISLCLNEMRQRKLLVFIFGFTKVFCWEYTVIYMINIRNSIMLWFSLWPGKQHTTPRLHIFMASHTFTMVSCTFTKGQVYLHSYVWDKITGLQYWRHNGVLLGRYSDSIP